MSAISGSCRIILPGWKKNKTGWLAAVLSQISTLALGYQHPRTIVRASRANARRQSSFQSTVQEFVETPRWGVFQPRGTLILSMRRKQSNACATYRRVYGWPIRCIRVTNAILVCSNWMPELEGLITHIQSIQVRNRYNGISRCYEGTWKYCAPRYHT